MGTETVFSPWIDFYGNLTNRTAQRVETICREIEAREYTPGKLFSDVLAFWVEGTRDWYCTLLGLNQSVPTVLFTLSPDTKTDSRSIPVILPRSDQPKPHVFWLGKVGPMGSTGNEISETNVIATLEKQYELIVDIKGLQPPLKAATYHALVHVDGKPLALVYVNVS